MQIGEICDNWIYVPKQTMNTYYKFLSRISREFFAKIFTACCYVQVGIDDDNPDELVVCTSTYTDKYTFYLSEVELRDLNTDTK